LSYTPGVRATPRFQVDSGWSGVPHLRRELR